MPKSAVSEFRLVLALFLTFGVTLPAHTRSPNPIAHPSEDSIRYIFRKGDTLYALAGNYMAHRDDWRTVQRINRVIDPHAIPPGRSLVIPTRLLKAEPLKARIIAFKGTCQLSPPEGGTPIPLANGMQVIPGSRLETAASSFATLELSNRSRITLPSNTRIHITEMRKFLLTGSVDFNFLVEQGRIETAVTPLKGAHDRYRIRTPIATAAVRGTEFRVGYQGEKAPSLTEVLDGTVGVGAGTNAVAAIPVEKGFGAGISADGAIRTEALLPPPERIDPGKVQADPVVSLAFSPIEGAHAYHVQLARDAGFVELEREVTSASPEARFEDIPNGRWFVRATAIAASGLEGMPQTSAMRRVLAGIAASAEGNADGGWRFRWSGSGEGRRIFHFTLRPDVTGAVALVDAPALNTDTLTLSDLPPGAYVWRVGVRQYADGEEIINWLPEQKLSVAPPSLPKN